MIVHYIVNVLRARFVWRYFWTASALIDVLTLPPMLMLSDAWISLTFLRVYRALLAVERLDGTGALQTLSEVHKAILWLTLRSLSMICIYSAAIFTAEVLGPLPRFEDRFITTAMGEISFFQMFYWVITTISTVGYGDFAPTTIVSRLLTMLCIVAGVVSDVGCVFAGPHTDFRCSFLSRQGRS